MFTTPTLLIVISILYIRGSLGAAHLKSWDPASAWLWRREHPIDRARSLAIRGGAIASDEQQNRRLIGGEEIHKGDWPWLVSIQGKFPTKKILGITIKQITLYCGASLLNDRWLLTAAHCFLDNDLGRDKTLDPSYWHGRLGNVNLDSSVWQKVKGVVGKLFNVKKLRDWYIKAEKIIVHPQYDKSQMWLNDIALIKLKEDVPSGAEVLPYIQKVPLPTNGANFPTDGQQCVLEGWGCTQGGGSVTSTARSLVLPKVPDSECANFWHTTTDGRFCAGYNLAEKGICPGDSGGPLVCKIGEQWTQAGIASFTSANRPGNVPGVFTRVTKYLDWIQQTMNNN